MNSRSVVSHCLVPLFILLLPSFPLFADALMISRAMKASTIAEFFIEESVVRVELEIGLQELPGFANLMPDEIFQRLGNEPEPLAERLPRFFREDLVIRIDGGPPLPGRVLAMEPQQRVLRDEITGEPVPVAEEDGETVIAVVLEYPFSGNPAFLSLAPPRIKGSLAATTIGFMAYHRGLPVNDFRYLSTEEILDLDWEDPWYSRFRNRNLWRQYNAPLNAFIYVENYEVRVEIIARPIDLQQWVDLGLEGRDTIPVERQEEMKQQVVEFLAGHIDLTIDGEPVTPALDRINFLKRTLTTSTVVNPPVELNAVSATLGVIFIQPIEGLPQRAALTWDLFTPKLPQVRAAATDEAGPLPFILQPDDNILEWKNFLKNPTIPTMVEIEPPPTALLRLLPLLGWLVTAVLAVGFLWSAVRLARGRAGKSVTALAALLLVCAVAGSWYAGRSTRPDQEKTAPIVSALLTNIYRAFDFRDENTIYDVLARSVTGDLLTQTYLETRRGLELANQGGARAKVKELDLVSVDPRPISGESGFVALCTWNVAASVGHWGHIHQRNNQYQAELTVKPVDGMWKITSLELIQEERI